VPEKKRPTYVAKPATLRERIQNLRYSYAQRREQSREGITRSGRTISRARSGIQRGKSALSYAKSKTRKLKEIQQKHGESIGYALGKEFRQSTPKFDPLKRKKGVRE
jgi:hypothetical protein